MTLRTHLAALTAFAALTAASPVWAQSTPAVPADANKALWCSTAFGIVAPQARAQKQDAAADSFTKYAKTLSDNAADSLKKAGFTDEQVKAQTPVYADKVNKELTGSGNAEFSVIECTQLVDPGAAAKIQQGTGAPADAGTPAAAGAAPTAPATPDTTTPVPGATTTPAPSNP